MRTKSTEDEKHATEQGLGGGEDGIRTHETLLEPTPLAGERLQPLGHLSAGGDINEIPMKQGVLSCPRNGQCKTLLGEQNRNRTQVRGKSGEPLLRNVPRSVYPPDNKETAAWAGTRRDGYIQEFTVRMYVLRAARARVPSGVLRSSVRIEWVSEPETAA